MKSFLDLDDRTTSSFCGNDFDLDKERELNKRLSSWYGEEKLLIERKSDARKVIGSLKTLFEEKRIKVIVIGGTNGQGETSHRLDSLLRREGLRTSLWTSPHVLSLRERFLWQGEQVTYEDLNESLDEGRRLCQKNGWSLSYYEFLFFVFCKLTLKLEESKGLDVIILEVGLGGRLDAVNFLGPDLTAICSLSRDHQGILGNTLTEILKEKLGISRKNVPLITGLELSYLQAKTHTHCLEGGIPHFDLFKRGFLKKNDSYVFRNKVLAYLLKEVFLLERKVPIEDFLNPLEVRKKVDDQVFPNFRGSKGRFEVWPFDYNNELLFVGAHNIDGIRKLTEVLKGSVFNHVLYLFKKGSKDM